MKAAILAQLLADQRDKRCVVLCTTLPTGEQRLIYPGNPRTEAETEQVYEAAQRAAAQDQCLTLDQGEGTSLFFEPYNPRLRLILVGAVHIAQPLSQMAALAGFEVIIVDPRSAFSTEARFPGVERVIAWPDRALLDLRLDRRAAVVTLTHDPKLDDPALGVALRSEAFYVGCLGSGKTHAARLERLRASGLDEAAIARIFGPVGLKIRARSLAEIAVSILAQIIEQLRRG
ncbi:MAG: XdhC family protein [Minicystis sp.]